MMAASRPHPDDLRFDYRPFDQPLEWHMTTSAGEAIDMTKRGQMRAVWDSPEGPFYLAWASAEDMTETYQAESQLRQRVAETIAEAYDRAQSIPRKEQSNG